MQNDKEVSITRLVALCRSAAGAQAVRHTDSIHPQLPVTVLVALGSGCQTVYTVHMPPAHQPFADTQKTLDIIPHLPSQPPGCHHRLVKKRCSENWRHTPRLERGRQLADSWDLTESVQPIHTTLSTHNAQTPGGVLQATLSHKTSIHALDPSEKVGLPAKRESRTGAASCMPPPVTPFKQPSAQHLSRQHNDAADE